MKEEKGGIEQINDPEKSGGGKICDKLTKESFEQWVQDIFKKNPNVKSPFGTMVVGYGFVMKMDDKLFEMIWDTDTVQVHCSPEDWEKICNRAKGLGVKFAGE